MFLLVKCKNLFLLLEDLKIRWTPDRERATRFSKDDDSGVLIRPLLERMVPHVVIVMERHAQMGTHCICECINILDSCCYHSDVRHGATPIIDAGQPIGSLSF